MKKNVNHFLIFILLTIIISISTSIGCTNVAANDDPQGQEKTIEETSAVEINTTTTEKTISISGAVTCKDVNSNSLPIEPTSIFDTGVKIVHLTFYVYDFTTQDKITVKWNYLETNEVANITNTYPPSDGGFNNIQFYLSHDKGLPSGKYNVEIYLNDNLAETVNFSIK